MLDKTQHQSAEDIRKSRDLSLETQRPPSTIPGYSLQEFLGSGAYGEVWSATNEKTGRKVAIKFYTGRSRADIQLLASEVEKLVVLAADRYVVQLLDVGWDAQPPYYVMDYIEHGSLEDHLSKSEPMPAAHAVELFQEIATGMMHLHGRGILHCDLKPGNVLLDQDGKPRVADFGQSRLSSDETSALGTLFFMAPEQADLDAAPDARWDVYGLGALFYSMLTGEPPYYSPEVARQLEATHDIGERLQKYRECIQTAEKPTAHRKVHGVDRMLAEIVDQCIAANPKQRYASIQSVLFALRQREVVRARRPLMVLGLIGPLLLMAVMSLFGLWAFNQAVGDSEAQIIKKAKESNEFAAKFAARSAAYQIDEYFRVVGQLARDEEFKTAFKEFETETKGVRKQLANFKKGEFDESLISDFKENDAQNRIQEFVDERMYDNKGDYPRAASWFISDRWGNQVASAFPRGQVNRTLGRNWAFRTYFTGLAADIKRDENGNFPYDFVEDEEAREIINHPHLCAVFLSGQTNTWKIAFSVPIFLDGEVRGIVAATTEVGHFVEFPRTGNTGRLSVAPGVEKGKIQYEMLVDGRPGSEKGVILQHPLFENLLADPNLNRIPDEIKNCVLNKNLIKDTPFFDPVGQEKAGAKYSQKSVAASAAVKMKSLKPDSTAIETTVDSAPTPRDDTELYVVIVEDYDSIIAPAHVLGRTLGGLAALAAAFFVLVAVGMWLSVARMLRDSRKRLDRTFSPASESTILESMDTVGAPIVPGTEEYDH